MNRMTLSVAMCTYNGERYLGEQLQSIVAQVRLPDELVICDDRSSDKTVTIIREFAANSPFPIRLFENSETFGTTKNFERALSLCRHDVIFLCDQDDSWHPEKLQTIERAFLEHPEVGVVFSDADIVDRDLKPTGCSVWKSVDFSNRLRYMVDAGRAFEALLTFNFVTGATMAFRKEFCSLIIPIPDLWVHDAWIAILLSAVADVIRVDRALIKYRQHSLQQLGARRGGIATHISTAQASNTQAEYKRRLEQFVLVRQRLHEQKGFDLDDRIHELIWAKIEHIACRASLPKSRLRRLPAIGRELLLKHYRHFGHGWKGAVRDLLVNFDD